MKLCFICDLVWMGTAVITASRSSHGACQHACRIDRAPFSSENRTRDEFNFPPHRTKRIVDQIPCHRYASRNVTIHFIPLHSMLKRQFFMAYINF
ncbi:hypothetical protein EZV77_24845 [Burkholderia thailandensis]|nr:hypothetical protein CWD92_01720 [Burkholderia thailandensis]TBW57317.1 hypothetical protein EZV77_24845 [Burkholderia thailandensis]